MAFKIFVMPSAISDLENYTNFVAEDSLDRSRTWLQGAWEQIFSLAEMPERFSVIEESEELGQELRDLIYHAHRIVYRIDRESERVEILRVWHCARRALGVPDVANG